MNKEKLIKILKNTAAIIVIIAMLVIIFYQNRDRDIFKFGRDESSTVVSSEQDGSGSDTYLKSDARRIGDRVAFVTPSSYSVLNTNAGGDNMGIAVLNPVLNVCGRYATVYEVGAVQVLVYKESKLAYSIAAQNKIIKAKVNGNGYLLLATEKDGYNCECTVYNRSGEAIFKWSISKSEFLDGMVNSSNNAIVLSVATAKDDKLCGEIELIDITDASMINRLTYESQLFYEVYAHENDNYAAFGNNTLIFLNSDGTQKWSYDYTGRKLLKADISNPDIMVLALEPEGNVIKGSATEIITLNRLGKVRGEKLLDSSVVDISLSENAVAIAYGKKILIADEKLREKKTVKSESSIEKIALYNDNNHLFVIGSSDSKILK